MQAGGQSITIIMRLAAFKTFVYQTTSNLRTFLELTVNWMGNTEFIWSGLIYV